MNNVQAIDHLSDPKDRTEVSNAKKSLHTFRDYYYSLLFEHTSR